MGYDGGPQWKTGHYQWLTLRTGDACAAVTGAHTAAQRTHGHLLLRGWQSVIIRKNIETINL